MVLEMKVKIEKVKVSYSNLLSDLIESLHKDPMKPFVGGMSERWEISSQTQHRLDRLCDVLLPEISKRYYNNETVKIIDTKFLRHLKDTGDSGGAFNWHADNHPPDVLNIMVYLSDVDEDGGGMEWIEVDDDVQFRPFTNPPGGKVLENEVSKLKSLSKFKTKKMTGNIGTTFVFDNCILHRATKVCGRDRDALILQVEPK
jgi:hypothetical protein